MGLPAPTPARAHRRGGRGGARRDGRRPHPQRLPGARDQPPADLLPARRLLPRHGAAARRGGSFCEWKGQASYVDVVGGDPASPVVAERAGWLYPTPTRAYAALVDHVALYPGAMDRCTVAGEVVRPQPGGFYGGWVTSRVVGPFKGDPGTMFW